jgi:hypothetical protein
LVNNKLVIEIKTKRQILSSDYKQIKKYLSENYPVGLILSFSDTGLKIKRSEYNYSKQKKS